MNWYSEGCPVCPGDLHDDLDDKGWVTCFSCARSFRLGDELLAEALRSKTAANDSPAAVPAARAA